MTGPHMANSGPPMHELVLKQCKYVLSLDEDDDITPIPQFLINEISRFMARNPYDDNFVIELEAGNGFGIATCVDDNCYCDIVLPRSPRFADGGKSTGLGDLDAYATHCLEYAHVQARDARVKKKQEAEKRKLIKLGKLRSLGSSGLSKLARQPSLTFSQIESKPKLANGFSSESFFGGSQPKLASQLAHTSPTSSRAKQLSGPFSPPIAGSSKLPQSPRDAVRSAWANKVLPPLGRDVDVKPMIKDEDVEMDDTHLSAPGASRKRSNMFASDSTQEYKKPVKKGKPNQPQSFDGQDIKPPSISSDSEVEFVSAKKSLLETGKNALTQVKREEDVVFTGENVAPPKPEVVVVGQKVTPSVQPNVSQRVFTDIDDATAKRFDLERQALDKALSRGFPQIYLQRWIQERKSTIVANLSKREIGLPYRLDAPSPALLLCLPLLKEFWPNLERDFEAERMARYAVRSNAVPGPSNAAAGASSLFARLSNTIDDLFKPVVDALGAAVPVNHTQAERMAQLQEQITNGGLTTGWHAPVVPGGLLGPGHAGGLVGVHNPLLLEDDLPGEPIEDPMVGDELTKFMTEALNDFDDNVTVAQSAEYLELASLHDCLPKSSIKLMPHQIIGVAWMTKQERNPRIRGGLLADSMGLGKTVQALATCLMNPSADPRVKTTLIVAPLGLLPQWKAEIESKTFGATVCIYHGPDREREAKRLRKYDYILISYGTLVTEFPQKEKKQRRPRVALTADDDTKNDEPISQNRRPHGPIAKMRFHRIILDEAHTIRNKSTQMSQACFELDGTFRWALSGTVVINDLTDVFPLLHFCDISAVRDWDNFREKIVKPSKKRPRLAIKRLQAILTLFALRRHANSRIEDQPILQLPPLEVTMDSLDLDPDELAIYETIEKRARIRINKYLAEGSMVKNYQHVLTMLLRLRVRTLSTSDSAFWRLNLVSCYTQQVACHPRLIVRKQGDNGHADDLLLNKDDELFATGHREELRPDDVIEQARRVGGHALVHKLQEVLANRAEEIALDPASFFCSICLDAFENEHITACAHSFCKICITDVMTSPLRHAEADPEALRPGARPCPMCRRALTTAEIFKAEPFQPAETCEASVKPEGKADELGEESNELPLSQPVKGKGNGKGNGKGRAMFIDSYDNDEAEEEDIPLSTKMRRMFELLDDWLQDDDTKCLVFSTFTSLLDLCSKAMASRGISHEMYTGSMKTSEREEAIKSFKRPGRNAPRVCLISTKAGGVGLNLCEANKVIILDFSWTDAAERQALSRAHRIGQTKPVEVRRLSIRGSVDERINALQEKKKALADGAFGEGGAGQLGRLTVNELIGLFGVNPRGLGLDEDD